MGFPDPNLAAAVAFAESGGNSQAQGDPRGPFGPVPNGASQSFGLWQVHVPSHPEYRGHEPELLTPEFNARAALAISQNGANWQPWSTYNSGLHKPYLA